MLSRLGNKGKKIQQSFSKGKKTYRKYIQSTYNTEIQ